MCLGSDCGCGLAMIPSKDPRCFVEVPGSDDIFIT